jgi:hypothetical protein
MFLKQEEEEEVVREVEEMSRKKKQRRKGYGVSQVDDEKRKRPLDSSDVMSDGG